MRVVSWLIKANVMDIVFNVGITQDSLMKAQRPKLVLSEILTRE